MFVGDVCRERSTCQTESFSRRAEGIFRYACREIGAGGADATGAAVDTLFVGALVADDELLPVQAVSSVATSSGASIDLTKGVYGSVA